MHISICFMCAHICTTFVSLYRVFTSLSVNGLLTDLQTSKQSSQYQEPGTSDVDRQNIAATLQTSDTAAVLCNQASCGHL